MNSMLTLMGIYQYDNSVLDNFQFPEEWTGEEKTTFINKLIFDTAELEILYPEPFVLKSAIGFWSRSELPQWEKLYKTEHFDYNPIWNKDGTVTETEEIGRTNNYTDDRNSAGSNSEHGTQGSTHSGNRSETETGSNSENTKDYVFGFNSSDKAQSAEQDITGSNSRNTSGTDGSTDNVTTDNSGNSNVTEKLQHTGDDSETRTYTRKEQGNIGITTTQQMIKEEREVDKFNLMDYIIDRFKQRFCLLVY